MPLTPERQAAYDAVLANEAKARAVTGGEGVYWRVGSHVGRTIYVCDEDNFRGVLIGTMDTPELAKLVVDAVNTTRGYSA